MSNGADISGHADEVSITGDPLSTTCVHPDRPWKQLCRCTNANPGTVLQILGSFTLAASRVAAGSGFSYSSNSSNGPSQQQILLSRLFLNKGV
jgi:hypothetical protein